jgi:transcription elongation factor B polypeptide 3
LDILSDLQTPEEGARDEKRNKSQALSRAEAEKASLLGFTSRKGRTTVYSGTARGTLYTHVLKLEDLCLRILMDNVDKLGAVGDAPYYLIKPVLRKCDPVQLMRVEDLNPVLLEDTDELWAEHCSREFKGKEPEEDESWREFYFRAKDERTQRLQSITRNIKASKDKAAPVRTAVVVEAKKTKASYRGRSSAPIATGSGMSRGSSSSSTSSSSSSSSYNGKKAFAAPSAPPKKKSAPLMAKSLQMMKSRFRR